MVLYLQHLVFRYYNINLFRSTLPLRGSVNNNQILVVLDRRRDLLHLEITPEEWTILEDITELLEPFIDVTTYLIAESYPTISALEPWLTAVQVTLVHSDNNSIAVRNFKTLPAADMSTQYQSTYMCFFIAKQG